MFLNSFFRSRLGYSCQNWNLTVGQFQKLDVTYQNLLRRMITGFKCIVDNDGDFWYNLNNEKVHTICCASNVSNFIRKQQKDYAGNVCGVCVCVYVCVCVCLYSSTVEAFSVCKMSETYLKAQINDLMLWILIWVLLPSSFISVSENVIFHLQRRKLQLDTKLERNRYKLTARGSDKKILKIRRLLQTKFFSFESSPWH